MPDDVAEEAAVLLPLKQLIAPRNNTVTRALLTVLKYLLHQRVLFNITNKNFLLLDFARNLVHKILKLPKLLALDTPLQPLGYLFYA